MSASHIIQAGIDLFIRKNEAYIVNRRNKENRCSERKRVRARCVCESTVRRHANRAQAHGSRRNRTSCRREKTKEASHVPNSLMAGRVSVEHWSRRTETVSPQRDEHCRRHFQCDNALSVTSGGNDIELNGEMDDQDVEDEVTRFDDGTSGFVKSNRIRTCLARRSKKTRPGSGPSQSTCLSKRKLHADEGAPSDRCEVPFRPLPRKEHFEHFSSSDCFFGDTGSTNGKGTPTRKKQKRLSLSLGLKYQFLDRGTHHSVEK